MNRPPDGHEDAGIILPRISRAVPPPRRSATWARLVGATGLLALTMTLFWLLTDESFRVSTESVSIEGIRLADEQEVREHIAGIERSPNAFRVRASELVRDLQGLPGVSAAAATVVLPANIEIHITERQPVFAWSNGVTTWLVDGTGMLFAPGTDPDLGPVSSTDVTDQPDTPEPSADPDPASELTPIPDSDPASDAAAGLARDDPTALGLPLIEDHRLVEAPPRPGDHLPAIDLAVMRQLLALTPELLSSRSEVLRLSIDERDGYVLRSEDLGWQAVFGHYTPTLHSPDVVPRQVQCLRWLLADREPRVVRVRLVPSGSGCGTFTRVRQTG